MRRKSPKNPYRLSESTLNLLHDCERKMQLERLLLNGVEPDGPPNAYLVRGLSFGTGVQAYMLTGDMDYALFKAWLEYYPEVYDDRSKIYMWRTLNNILCAKDQMDKLRQRYEVAVFEGKPAVEMSFRLDIDDKWYYVGYIDLVLYDTWEKMYVVFEIKTTGYKLTDLAPLYKNSGQALGYSIVIDRIVGVNQANYGVLYFVCRDQVGDTFIPDIYAFPFTKTLLDRLRWFYTLGMDVQRLNQMLELEMFPMRGHSCVKFSKVCQHFGVCTLTSADIRRPVEQDNTEYQFRYKLQDVIAEHLARVSSLQPPNMEIIAHV